MKWMISEDRLGSDQREVIDEIGKISSRPIWIQGYAGSGKSVLLLHSLKDYLAKKSTANICVVVFTNSLVDLLSTGLKQIPFLEGKKVPVYTIYDLKKRIDGNSRYDAIFCDEIQDLPIEFIKRMKVACTHLIIAGDAAQSIYTSVPVFNTAPATPSEIVSNIQPVEKRLGVIYRLTKSVIAMLRNVFTEMLGERPVIGNVDTEIKLFKSASIDGEISYCWAEAKETNQLRTSDVIAILLYGHDAIVKFVNSVLDIESKPIWTRVNKNNGNSPDYDLLNSHLEKHKVPLMYIGNGHGSLVKADSENKIVIMTYHSAKGLDFDYVYLPMVGSNMSLHSSVPVNALLLVALSRSKSGLTITYTGDQYRSLKPFLRSITPKSLPNPNTNSKEILF
jgi:superfamily I DNA/RNA helicase